MRLPRPSGPRNDKNKAVKALILKAPGTNCDHEMAYGLEMAGAQTRTAYFYELEKNPGLIKNYGLLVFPGGFSYGDYLGSGKLLALFSELAFKNNLNQFLAQGGRILGVCNGFQALTKLGLLPGAGKDAETRRRGDAEKNDERLRAQAVSLAPNKNGKFECRWVRLKLETKSIFFRSYLSPSPRLPLTASPPLF